MVPEVCRIFCATANPIDGDDRQKSARSSQWTD
ncbi:adenosine-specific kinase [Pseudomonas sp. UYIF39]|nr:hypothetical protein [Pseudomonas sp. UYIF39]MDI3357845.1 adenosine-specific kinase [Pseudomonas sp. UYIF39]